MIGFIGLLNTKQNPKNHFMITLVSKKSGRIKVDLHN